MSSSIPHLKHSLALAQSHTHTHMQHTSCTNGTQVNTIEQPSASNLPVMTPGAWAAMTAWGSCGRFTEPAVIAPRMDAPATASWNKRVGHIETPPGQRPPSSTGEARTRRGKKRERETHTHEWTRDRAWLHPHLYFQPDYSKI